MPSAPGPGKLGDTFPQNILVTRPDLLTLGRVRLGLLLIPVLLLAAAFSGCRIEPKPPPSLTVVALEDDPEIAAAEPLGTLRPIPARPSPKPSSVPLDRTLSSAWVPLEDYCRLHGVGLKWKIDRGLPELFHIQTAGGPTTLRVDSRIGDSQGIRFWMAHGPRFLGETPHIHKLDADKNLLPLLHTGPSGFDRRVILIDAGHGGSNVGTRNDSGTLLEKSLTLDWGLRLKRVLEDRGWNVFMSRQRDETVSLSERVAQADRVGAVMFVSLHFNSAAPNKTRTGIETYCLTPAGLSSTLVRYAPEDMDRAYPNNQFDTANMIMAMAVHRALIRRTGAEDRGVRRARFMTVLQGQRRPAILVEGGFLSTPEEAAKISQASYRQVLAEAVASGLEAYRTGEGSP